MDDTPRWKYRFDNYSKALDLLREGVEGMREREYSQLEKEGLIQRFEYTIELAWKVMKDYLDSEGVPLDEITPRKVIRSAFESKVVEDGETWMDALDARNRMSHTYDVAEFEAIIEQVRERFLAAFNELHARLGEKVDET